MRSSILLALMFSSACVASAQAGASHPLYIQPPASRSCPIALSANREPGGSFHSVKDGVVLLNQQLRINFAGDIRSAIIKADVVAHGVETEGGEGMILVGPSQIARNSSESFQLVGSAAAPLLHPLISTSGMTAISWIEVTRLEYADGKVWQPTANSRCVAAPSLLVLVDSGH